MVTAVENEFKFTTDDCSNVEHILQELESYLIEKDIIYSYRTKQSVDSYFDSKHLLLYSAGCMLRRKVSSTGKIKHTFKEPISNDYGMMSRQETERTSDGSFKDLCNFVREIYPDINIEEQPVFTMECERAAYDLDNGTNLSIDLCTYVSGKKRKDFLEIELECMSDVVNRDFDSEGLCDLALELGFEQVTRSKYQRGVEWLRAL